MEINFNIHDFDAAITIIRVSRQMGIIMKNKIIRQICCAKIKGLV